MPAQSEKQRRYIFHLRGKYKSKEKTPAKWKWIWEEGWEKLEESLSFDDLFELIEAARD